MTRRTLAVAALGLMLAACGGAQERKFSKADSDQIRQRTRDLVAAVNARDVVKAADFYAATATFMPPNAATVHGRDSVQLYYQTVVDAGTTELTMEPRDVGGVVPAAGPGLAYMNGTYSMIVRSQSGAEQRDRGKYLLVMRNTGGQWRCEYSMWNSDLPKTLGSDQ
jgi:ketosteroid isomerase-like protein